MLTRRPGEVIEIGADVKVRVLEVRSGGQVKIAIEAPREMPVHRAEVAERIRAEKARA